MIAVLSNCKTKHDNAISSRQTGYVNSGATALRLMEDYILSMHEDSVRVSTGTFTLRGFENRVRKNV